MPPGPIKAAPVHGRRARQLALGLLAMCGASLALGATAAQAVIIPGEYGVQQRAPLASESVPKSEWPLAAPLQYHGGPVTPASNTYAIYWDPVGAYRNDWMRLIDHYLYDVGADSGKLSNVFSLNTQYTGLVGTRAEYNSTFRGAYTDAEPYPAAAEQCKPMPASTDSVCIKDETIRQQLKHFVYVNGLPYGIDTVYFVLTPPGVNVCTEHENTTKKSKEVNCSGSTQEEEEAEAPPSGICGYHSVIDRTSAGPILYAVQPWIAGDAGRILNIDEFPVKTAEATPPVLACQNGARLVEPNQTGSLGAANDYETGLADVIINDLSIEQSDMLVDPLLNGWYQVPTPASERLYEQGDMCQRAFSPSPEELPKVPVTTKALNLSNETIDGDKYYLQWAFDSTGVTSGKGVVCWSGTELIPHFTAPNPVNVNDIVAFDANESAMTLDANPLGIELFVKLLKLNAGEEPFTVPSYSWSFGDGTPVVSGASYASVFHSYQYGGAYAVALTVTDSGGNVATYSRVVDVNGPPAPTGGASSGSSSTGSTVSPAGAVTPPSTGTATGTPAPAVYDFIASHSLTKVLRYGLALRYAVNEQVAGSMEVMLDARTAKRLHIHGSPARGLPKGYAHQVVLGGAVLVTTTAGHGTLRVRFPKPMAEKLARAHRLKLTIRIVVRNAQRPHPKTATLLSTVVLKG